MSSDRETIGTLFVEKQQLFDEYLKLLGLVEQIVTGHIRPDQITVDMATQSWAFVPTSEEPPEATPSEDPAEAPPDA